MKLKYLVGLLSLITIDVYALGWFGSTLGGLKCDGKGQGFGPYDYIEVVNAPKGTPLYNKTRLWEVDKIHFGKGVEILKRSGFNKTTMKQASNEFDYTVRAFPNHTKALYALINLELRRIEKNKSLKEILPPPITPPECYLQRALAFNSNQAHIYQLYAYYLQKLSFWTQAELQYMRAIQLDPYNSEAHYHYGLLLFRLKKYDEAVVQAKKAAELNYPLTGLKNMLVADGRWKN